jgi:hypothetical protein
MNRLREDRRILERVTPEQHRIIKRIQDVLSAKLKKQTRQPMEVTA